LSALFLDVAAALLLQTVGKGSASIPYVVSVLPAIKFSQDLTIGKMSLDNKNSQTKGFEYS